MKVGAGALEATQVLAKAFLIKRQERPKSGETKLTELIRREPGDLEVFKFPEKQLKEVQKALKEFKVLYSILPDLNKKDGFAEIMFPVSAASRINSIVNKLGFGKIGTLEEYARNADPEDLAEAQEQGVEVGMGRELQEIYSLNEYQRNLEDPTRTQIEVMRHMVLGEEESALKIKIPGEQRYIRVNKSGAYPLGNGSLLMFLDQDQEYSLYNMRGRQEGIRAGSELAAESFVPYQNQFYQRGSRRQQREQMLVSLRNLDQKEEIPDVSADANLQEYQRHFTLSGRLEIEVTPQTIMENRDAEMVVRVPGEHRHYVSIDKAGMYPLGNGNLLMYLSAEKNYRVYDEENEGQVLLTGNQVYESFEAAKQKMYPTAADRSEREALASRLRPTIAASRYKWDMVESSPDVRENNIVVQEEQVMMLPPVEIEIPSSKVFRVDGKQFSGWGDEVTAHVIPSAQKYSINLEPGVILEITGKPVRDGKTLSCSLYPEREYQVGQVEQSKVVYGNMKGNEIIDQYFSQSVLQALEENIVEISINQKLIYQVDGKNYAGYDNVQANFPIPEGREYLTRIPYHPKEYLLISKEEQPKIQGKTLYCKMSRDKIYQVKNLETGKISRISGKKLVDNYKKPQIRQKSKHSPKFREAKAR
nr:PcfB family protein [Cuneatibacter caecimuris]